MGDFVLREEIPRWLKLDPAARYSGLGKHQLKALAKADKIRGGKVRVGADPQRGRKDWFFDRLSIDAFLESQIRPAHIDRAVNDIAAEMGS